MKNLSLIQKIRKADKKNSDQESSPFKVLLDKESIKRFHRLKSQFSKLNDSQLIALSLRALEQKAKRIIKKQVIKRVLALRNDGLNPQNIAEYLNHKKVPTFNEKEKWQGSDISRLIDQ